MKCIICESKSTYFFEKKYDEPPYDNFMENIGPVQYYKCTSCGFVLSKTHAELSTEAWSELNSMFHHHLESNNNIRKINQPPYMEQAMMLSLLGTNNIISLESIIDYAGGYGTLSDILKKYYSITLPIYDPYVKSDYSEKYITKSKLNIYKSVINSAMFEHVLKRDDLEQVNSLVSNDGCLIIHTVVCEKIPNDPQWFYLRPPVHTAFHTNKSMTILMNQWNYKSSIYCQKSKCWVLLKQNTKDLHENIHKINEELQHNWFISTDGFIDYWKGF